MQPGADGCNARRRPSGSNEGFQVTGITGRSRSKRLRLAYGVAQVCDADARNHRRVAEDGWRAGEVVEESNPGAKKDGRDVDVDLVEEAGVQALLDGLGAVDPDRLPGGG